MNNVVIVWGEQRRDSAIHIHVCILSQTPIPSSLPRNIQQGSMCYSQHKDRTLLVIHLNIAVCIGNHRFIL